MNDFVEMYKAHGLFTCCDASQYVDVLEYYESMVLYGMTLEKLNILVYMTWICSDRARFSVDDIRDIIDNSLLFGE